MKIKRKIEKNKNMYQKMFQPKSVAIVGASNKKDKVGTVLADNITKLGYQGKIYFVNPSYKLLRLKRCYPSLSAIKKEIDLTVVAVPAKFVLDVVKDAMATCKNFVVISAGFSEIGKEGAEMEKRLLELAQKNNLNIIGPNCLGFIVPGIKLNASFAGGMPKKGNIAFASQSGALAVALLDKANGEHLGFSHVVSVGNQMQVNECELLEYFATDKETRVIAMYLEGIKDGTRFIEVARKVSKIKPVVILKAGKTEKAQHAISSHTGALAGSDEIVDVAFEKAGVIRANTLEEFFDLITLISFSNPPKNNKVAVITNAGGAGVLATDAFKGKEIELAEFSEKLKAQIKNKLPNEASVQNPIDVLGDADEKRYQSAFDGIKSTAGMTIAMLTPQKQTPVEKIAQIIIERKQKNSSVMASVFIGGDRVKNAISHLKKNDVPNFSTPDSAVIALDKYYKWSIFKKDKNFESKNKANLARKKNIANVIEKAKRQERAALLFDEAAKIMSQYGIDSGKYWTVMPTDKGGLIDEFPVVAKIDSDKVLHKSDKQGVVLNIKNSKQLEEAIFNLQQNFPNEQILVQSMQQKQIELILGIKQDAIFGPVIVYGLGGIYTEVFRMVNFLIGPMTEAEIANQVLNSKIGFLFRGVRGQAQYDLKEFSTILKNVMDFAADSKVMIKGFDINPLFIYNDGRKASAVDIKIMI